MVSMGRGRLLGIGWGAEGWRGRWTARRGTHSPRVPTSCSSLLWTPEGDRG